MAFRPALAAGPRVKKRLPSFILYWTADREMAAEQERASTCVPAGGGGIGPGPAVCAVRAAEIRELKQPARGICGDSVQKIKGNTASTPALKKGGSQPSGGAGPDNERTGEWFWQRK